MTNLSVQLVLADVALDQVVHPPLDGFQKLPVLAGGNVAVLVVNAAPAQQGHCGGQGKTELNVVSRCVPCMTAIKKCYAIKSLKKGKAIN